MGLVLVPAEWIEEQFRVLGRRDAHGLAASLIATCEGSALLTSTLGDHNLLTREGRRLCRWTGTL